MKWNRDDELALLYLIPRSESETASVWEQLHKILAALWSELRLWLMS